MVEKQQMIVKARVNDEFDETDQELIKLIDDLVEDHLGKNSAISKKEKKEIIEECVRIVFDKIQNKIDL